MPGIFISYRREDAADAAGRIYDRLADRFGRDQIFMDIDTLEPGVDFVEAIQESVGSCAVLVAVIGKDWVEARDREGNRRLDNPEDFVRLEVGAALKREIRVIPTPVGGATMPRQASLPEGLAGLVRRHALEISHTRFHQDVDRLIAALEKILFAKADTGRASRREPERARKGTAPRKARPEVGAEAIVVDDRTGLMWTREDNGRDINWHEANEYARNLKLGGYSDWRQPTIEELEELHDPTRKGAYKIREPFRLTSHWVWISTKIGSGSAWGFGFGVGRRGRNLVVDSLDGRVLCVRRSGE